MASSTDVDLFSATKARELLREKLFSPRKGIPFSKDEHKSWPESRRRAFRLEVKLIKSTRHILNFSVNCVQIRIYMALKQMYCYTALLKN